MDFSVAVKQKQENVAVKRKQDSVAVKWKQESVAVKRTRFLVHYVSYFTF